MKLSRRNLFIILGVLVWAFIGWRVTPYITDLLRNGDALPTIHSKWMFLLAILLVPINWGIEAAKWHYLIFKKSKNGFRLAYKSVLSGMAIGILTPSRIGEPFARALMVPDGHYLTSTAAALICSITQQAATLLFGIIGALIVAQQFDISSSNLISVAGFGALLLSVLMLILMLSPTLLKWIAHHHFTKKVMESIRGIDAFTLKQVASIQGLSIIRYCIFTSQYMLILYAFGISASPLQTASAVTCIFLVGSIIPSPAIVDVGVKISLAILFLGTTLNSEKIAAIASTTIWIINLAIPAIVGTIFVMKNSFSSRKVNTPS